MKKIFSILIILMTYSAISFAQKYALLDMQYILKNIPAYQMMNKQLDDQSKKWQSEIEIIEKQSADLYKKYQNDLVFLSAEQKKKQEEEIVKVEKQAYNLKKKYFGPEGELFKKREALIKPINDEVWKVLKDLAKKNSYQMIIDKSSGKIVYADPSLDISSSVLQSLGF